MREHFAGNKLITTAALITLCASFLIAFSIYPIVPQQMPLTAYLFMLGWLGVAILSTLSSYRNFVIGFLLSIFSMLIAWRLAGLYNVTKVSLPLLLAFIFFCADFIYCAYVNLQQNTNSVSLAAWQLIFVRLYLGFNFIPHFTEKLFAGLETRLADVNAFIHLQVIYPDMFVWFAGLCEFGAAIALGLGFMMRLGAFCSFLYLFIATYLGHHFSLGFIWAGEGGGWEFATMWMVLTLSFAITGFNTFSIDQELQRYFPNIPKILKKLM